MISTSHSCTNIYIYFGGLNFILYRVLHVFLGVFMTLGGGGDGGGGERWMEEEDIASKCASGFRLLPPLLS